MRSTSSTLQELIRAQTAQPAIAKLMADWPALAERVIGDALAIQAIPAPTGEEGARAKGVRERFDSLGLHDVRLDEAGNVIGRTPGANPALPVLMISAHLDTVFPAGTDLIARHDTAAGRVTGPGLGDNSLGLAAMLGLAQQLVDHRLTPACDVWWAATTGEEGLGDLRGMRNVCQTLAKKLGLAIIIEGMGLGRVYHAGLGVRRLRIDVLGPGGHSWLHTERPSAIHYLLRLGALLVERIILPPHPRSSFNIGLISGGTSINTRAPQASLSIDLRSVDSHTLADMENEVMAVIARLPAERHLIVTTAVIGDRPSAALSPDHPLAQAARAALVYVNWGPSSLEIGSTDANIPLAVGIPSVCIGITTGGNAHSTSEYIDLAPVAAGMQQLTLLTLLAAENIDKWNDWYCQQI
jgi:tripeptide aminopeptidase